jgi:hypothetical protein
MVTLKHDRGWKRQMAWFLAVLVVMVAGAAVMVSDDVHRRRK